MNNTPCPVHVPTHCVCLYIHVLYHLHWIKVLTVGRLNMLLLLALIILVVSFLIDRSH